MSTFRTFRFFGCQKAAFVGSFVVKDFAIFLEILTLQKITV